MLLRCESLDPPMSQVGQSLRFADLRLLPLSPQERRYSGHDGTRTWCQQAILPLPRYQEWD
jgi:hypothetical protein